MSFATGSLIAWSKDGAYNVRVDGVKGERISRTKERKEEPSNVNSAPRRACAWPGSGRAESWARERWYPSIGTKPARGGTEVLPFRLVWRELRRWMTVDASVVLPVYIFLQSGMGRCFA